MSHSDACTEADFSFGLDSVEFGQDATGVWCQCGEDLTIATSEQDKKNIPRLLIICSMTKLTNRDQIKMKLQKWTYTNQEYSKFSQ